jgi:glutathione synthase
VKLGIVVNILGSKESGQTTYRLAASAANRGHDVFVMTAGSFSLEPDERILAHARTAPPGRYKTSVAYLAALQSEGSSAWIAAQELDVLLLRNNPAVQKPWAQHAGISFARLLAARGVLVLNDPLGLSRAMDKLYLQSFPEAVRPRTLITRSARRIAEFAKRAGTIIVKPLQGSGGRSVFIVRPDDRANMAEIIRAVARDGYVIAQEYLPAAAEGDTRLFLMNGRPLVHQGRYAAARRVRTGEDLRSNIHAGGRVRRAKVGPKMLELAEALRPRLVEDGMFLVGLDIAGDKLLEINVFSPGGLGTAEKFEKVDFTEAVISSLEQKVDYITSCRRRFENNAVATLQSSSSPRG